MTVIPDETLKAIGHLTVAMTDLEFTLAWIGADQEGGDPARVFAKPGEAVHAARGSVEFAPAAYREAFLQAVAAAGTLLAQSHVAVRALWSDGGEDAAIDLLQRPTKMRRPADPDLLNDLATRLLDCRARLDALIDAQLNDRPLQATE